LNLVNGHLLIEGVVVPPPIVLANIFFSRIFDPIANHPENVIGE
jgi:hypothetical protein